MFNATSPLKVFYRWFNFQQIDINDQKRLIPGTNESLNNQEIEKWEGERRPVIHFSINSLLKLKPFAAELNKSII